ncbi:O-antigen ligase family protein [Kistimonas asteriae]|uniref:O-antigen ligase family protein n=1 Tax=Kistimonas asteriae TaxID=517724 RepID=UPI001BA8A6EC|nr:O-antigen ligase family protein [Kistimonas asteriae]
MQGSDNLGGDEGRFARIDELDLLIKRKVLPLGLFVQMTGMLWVGSIEYYVMQTYIFCFFPGLLSLCLHLYRFGARSCFRGLTIGEKLLSFLLLWIVINSLFLNDTVSQEVVWVRVVTVCLYLYVVRTVMLYGENNHKLFLLSACVATFFALVTLVYHYGVLEQPIGIRVVGIEGYRVGILDIEEFGYLVSPILAALYYGVFATIFWVGLINGSYKSKWMTFIAIASISVIFAFILFSGSRGPLVAFVGMAVMGLLLLNSPGKSKLILVLLACGCALVLSFNQKIATLINNAFIYGFSGRFTIWETTIEYISKYPFFGHGSFAEYPGPIIEGRIMKHPHSMVLGLSFYWGIPAAILYLATIVWGMITSYTHRDQPHMLMAGCILVFGFIGMLTDTFNMLSRPGLEWLLFFFPVALCVSKKEVRHVSNNDKNEDSSF